MRKVIAWILLIAALGVSWYQWRTHKEQYRGAARILRARLFPCSSPITYSISAIDPRYAITAEELASALIEAEAAWETAARRDLFELRKSSGDVAVVFIYDERQAALDKLRVMGIWTDQTLDSYKTLKARYNELSATVEAADARLKGIAARYKEREAAYNSEVKRLNLKGSATPAEGRNIKNEREALSMQFGGITMIQEALNTDVAVLNALATTLNQLIVQLDLNVDQYNRAGAALGAYEEGLYRIAGGQQRIELYKYSSRAQLVSLLAHEMGHALGLEHVDDKESLMSPINIGRDLKLSPKDIVELGRVCR